jgi:hypothetical protein
MSVLKKSFITIDTSGTNDTNFNDSVASAANADKKQTIFL